MPGGAPAVFPKPGSTLLKVSMEVSKAVTLDATSGVSGGERRYQ